VEDILPECLAIKKIENNLDEIKKLLWEHLNILERET